MLWGGHKDYGQGLELTRAGSTRGRADRRRRLLAEARTRHGLMQLNLAQMTDSLRNLHGALALFRELGERRRPGKLARHPVRREHDRRRP